MQITLVTVVGVCHIGVLPHMLQHYRSLGVSDFIIKVHGDTHDEEGFRKLSEAAATVGANVASVHVRPWAGDLGHTLYCMARASKPNQWFLLCDADELQVYPDDLSQVVAYCEKHRYDYVEGCFVDRLSGDGTLQSVREDIPVWDQFPLGGMISARVLGATVNKIVLTRGHVRLITGHHMALSGNGCPPSEIYVPVHHFKWTAGVIEHLVHRAKEREAINPADQYARECRSFVAHYERNGRIDIANDRFLMGPCNPHYPFWERVVEWREVAPCFPPRNVRPIPTTPPSVNPAVW